MRRALTAVAVLALALPASAAAVNPPDTIINFEGVAYKTEITNQYASSGVTFGTPTEFGFPAAANGCASPGSATGSNAGMNGTDSLNISCQIGGEISPSDDSTAFEFGTERHEVSFDIEQLASDQTWPTTVTFYAIGGTVLHQETLQLAYGTVTHVSYDHVSSAGGIVGSRFQAGRRPTGTFSWTTSMQRSTARRRRPSSQSRSTHPTSTSSRAVPHR
jgi:hypothetical protein